MASIGTVIRKLSTRPVTSNARPTVKAIKDPTFEKPLGLKTTILPTKSKHRPSNSYSGQSKIPQFFKESPLNKPIKPLSEHTGLATAKIATPKSSNRHTIKSARHRRATSLADKPVSQNTWRKPESDAAHHRKFSLGSTIKQNLAIISSFSHETQKGFIPGNPGKVNQDNFFEHPCVAGYNDLHLFGVCDGHGMFGGEVSGYVKKRLPEMLAKHPEIYSDPKKVIEKSVIEVNEELKRINIDVSFSGTTLIFVLIKGSVLYCANVGDSRALIARQVNDTGNTTTSGRHWMSIVLSRDHKPDEKDESARIFQWGGRVESYQDENGNPLGPARVWLRNQDLPGLAMSRSLGDAVAASVGVICEPEILEFQMTPEDKFIVLGSDGVFEFISNEDIVKTAVPYWRINDSKGVCEALAKFAHDRWVTEEEVIDDITAVCVFLNIPNKN
ncbi:unnamed protein product [Blepharisma stoltei]|uniref:PPM-type phosphatase domain-containing protein n=1 Tax=Blepharisma stoltei TaxID=1481888 RepID=A0AAU9K2F8_9CILI|nr:unnamed protein product [Blepharisma stoltei]